jgi:hypothetical protein
MGGIDGQIEENRSTSIQNRVSMGYVCGIWHHHAEALWKTLSPWFIHRLDGLTSSTEQGRTDKQTKKDRRLLPL